MMRGGPLRLVATAGAAVVAGVFTLSLVSSVSLRTFQTVVENKRKKTAPVCGCCKGRGFTNCRLCKGESTIEWSPLYDPVVTKPCVCPTCDGNKVQRCLNCAGRGTLNFNYSLSTSLAMLGLYMVQGWETQMTINGTLGCFCTEC